MFTRIIRIARLIRYNLLSRIPVHCDLCGDRITLASRWNVRSWDMPAVSYVCDDCICK